MYTSKNVVETRTLLDSIQNMIAVDQGKMKMKKLISWVGILNTTTICAIKDELDRYNHGNICLE